LSVDIRETGLDADALSEFPGLPDGPEVLELPEPPDLLDLREPEVLDLREPEVVDLREPEVLDTEPDEAPDEAGIPEPRSPERTAVDGLSLHRLLDRAKPSLAEAAALSAVLLEALATMHDAGCTHGDLDCRSIQIGPRGDVRLDGRKPKSKARFDPEKRRADVRAAAAIVAEIGRAAGRPARPLTEREEKLVARLEAAADPRSLSRRGPLKAARGLELAVGRAEQLRSARRGIVELARAVADADVPTNSDIEAVPAMAGPASTATPPARSLPPPARRRPISPRVWKGAALAAVVALVLGLEVHFFGDAIKRNAKVLFSGDAEAAPADPRKPGPLPVLGPPAAGPITHLELRPLDGCRPEAVCNTVVQVTVSPQQAPLDVAWAFELVDRCDGRQESRPGGVFSIPAGRDRAVQTVAVPLPAGRSLTLVPLTSAPVKVAGTPLPLSADDRPC
jgi:hypothetical protein